MRRRSLLMCAGSMVAAFSCRDQERAKQLDAAPTLAGQSLPIRATEAGITVGGAKVVKADIDATNGVIHVIDKVLLPQ